MCTEVLGPWEGRLPRSNFSPDRAPETRLCPSRNKPVLKTREQHFFKRDIRPRIASLEEFLNRYLLHGFS